MIDAHSWVVGRYYIIFYHRFYFFLYYPFDLGKKEEARGGKYVRVRHTSTTEA